MSFLGASSFFVLVRVNSSCWDPEKDAVQVLYFSIGVSGPVADWCDLAVSGLSALVGGQAARLEGEGGALESGAVVLVRSGADSLAFAIRRLNSDLLASMRDINTPFLLALDDPLQMVGGNDVSALRTIANLCPFLMQFANLPNALCIRHFATDQPLSTLSMIANHFHMRVASSDIERLAGTMPVITRQIGIPNEVVRGALECYAEFFENGSLGDIVWDSMLFIRAADPTKPLSKPVRLRDTFNGRFLIYGPYLVLPPGHWTAKLVMTISPDGGGQTLTADVFNGKILSTVRFISRAGEFTSPSLDFIIENTDESPLEIRILIEREGAPGELLLRHAILDCQTHAARE